MRNVLLRSILVSGLAFVPVVLTAQSADTVRAAQQALKDKGFDPGDVDGVNGPKTRAATKAFQKQQNLQVDGRLGPQTLDTLGVKNASAGTEMHEAGQNLKNSYSAGGKDIGEGGKDLGHAVKHGNLVDGAKDFGKGVGEGAKKIGVGTGHAAKNAAEGVKDKVVGNKKDDDK